MEREGHPAAAAIPCRRWAEDVIVLSSGRPSWQPSAEGADPPPPEKLYYKTKLCDKYEASGRCTYEDGCTFAHGRAELRPPVPPPSSAPPHGFGGGVWRRPPGAEQDHRGGGYGDGGKVCHNFRVKGSCHFGDKCAFPHASPAPAPGAPIRGPGEQKLAAEARRSATPPAARPATAPRYVGAPAPGRAFPPRPRATARGASWSSWPSGRPTASTATGRSSTSPDDISDRSIEQTPCARAYSHIHNLPLRIASN